MLNSDQHNPNVKKRMTVEDFIRNNRGVNEKTDFAREYLEEVFRYPPLGPQVPAGAKPGTLKAKLRQMAAAAVARAGLR
eukprot:3516563-Rhodomonas_salina.2